MRSLRRCVFEGSQSSVVTQLLYCAEWLNRAKLWAFSESLSLNGGSRHLWPSQVEEHPRPAHNGSYRAVFVQLSFYCRHARVHWDLVTISVPKRGRMPRIWQSKSSETIFGKTYHVSRLWRTHRLGNMVPVRPRWWDRNPTDWGCMGVKVGSGKQTALHEFQGDPAGQAQERGPQCV